MKYTIEQVIGEDGLPERWVAQEHQDSGMVFYGYGNTPNEALANIESSHDSLKKALNYDHTVNAVASSVTTEKKKLKPMDTVRNQITDFFDKMSPSDMCMMNICTEVMLKATPTGSKREAGDMYMSVVAKKTQEGLEDFVLQEDVDYPAKKVYEYFQTVK